MKFARKLCMELPNPAERVLDYDASLRLKRRFSIATLITVIGVTFLHVFTYPDSIQQSRNTLFLFRAT